VVDFTIIMESPMSFKLSKPPIVEMVLDIECDLPAGQQITSLENSARNLFQDQYPLFKTQLIQQHFIEAHPDEPPKMSVSRQGVQAFQFLQEDEKQLVQIRLQGFSFNRLAPYTTLDDYLEEIERTWKLFVDLTSPTLIRLIRLRYINRILLPLEQGTVNLDSYLNISPRLPDERGLTLAKFLQQHSAIETETGNLINIILTDQPVENGQLPVILDISSMTNETKEPEEWSWVLQKIQKLRNLSTHIFRKSLTESCLSLFQH